MFDPAERLADGDAPDTSFVLHSTDTGHMLHADIQYVIQNTSASREILAEGNVPDASGVLQPTDTGNKLQVDIMDPMEDTAAPRK